MKVHPAICMKTKGVKNYLERVRRYYRKIRYLDISLKEHPKDVESKG
jgi:hypothetical protein